MFSFSNHHVNEKTCKQMLCKLIERRSFQAQVARFQALDRGPSVDQSPDVELAAWSSPRLGPSSRPLVPESDEQW